MLSNTWLLGTFRSQVFDIRVFKSIDLKMVRYLEAQMLRSHEVQFQTIIQNFMFRISEKEAPLPKP